MFCCISGEITSDPVVSRKSGHIYDRNLILQYIKINGNTDPINGDDLFDDDLLTVKTHGDHKNGETSTHGVHTPGSVTIPGMLGHLRHEYDSLILECFSLKKHINELEQELSQCLYQQDASVRVIARLVKERDQALELVKVYGAQAATNVGQSISNNDQNNNNINNQNNKINEILKDNIINNLTDIINNKIQERIKRKKEKKGIKKKIKLNQELTNDEINLLNIKSIDILSSWENRNPKHINNNNINEEEEYTNGSFTIHRSDKPGILCVDISPFNNNIIISGGIDKDALLFNRQNNSINKLIEDNSSHTHNKKVTSVCFHSSKPFVYTGSADQTVKVWAMNNEFNEINYIQTYNNHQHDITSISLHPSSQYLATTSLDSAWCLYDTERTDESAFLSYVLDPALQGQGLLCSSFHTDCALFGTGGMDNILRIWDIRQLSNVVSVDDNDNNNNNNRINCLSFSENGYNIICGNNSGNIIIWDLRKPSSFINKINLFDDDMNTSSSSSSYYGTHNVMSCSYDPSGSYIAAGGSGGVTKLWDSKNYSIINSFNISNDNIMDMKFESKMNYFVTVSLDRTMNIYS